MAECSTKLLGDPSFCDVTAPEAEGLCGLNCLSV